MLEDSSTEYEMGDIYICVRGTRGDILAGINCVGTEIIMTLSQPMKKLFFGNRANQGILLCCVCCTSDHPT